MQNIEKWLRNKKLEGIDYANVLYARYLCSRDALGLKAEQPSARDDRVSCIQANIAN